MYIHDKLSCTCVNVRPNTNAAPWSLIGTESDYVIRIYYMECELEFADTED